MGIDFILLMLPRSNHPRIIPSDKTRSISNALDIDSVQNKNVISTDVTFCMINTTAVPARIMPSMGLTFISIASVFQPAPRQRLIVKGLLLPIAGFARNRFWVV
jgi:hypothetical protein